MQKANKPQILKEHIQNYNELMDKIYKMTPQVLQIQQSVQSLITFVGGTGSGKSTLGCYLRDAKLQHKKVFGGRYEIDHHDTTGKYPKIGHQQQSCTTLPGLYKNKDQTFFIDLAGWFDTRSINQQILNAISNSMVFSKGKQIKIVIVIDQSEILAQRGGPLIPLIDRLIGFFQNDFKNIIDSILLVVSKVEVQNWELQDAQKKLMSISQNNQKIQGSASFLIKTLIQKKRIVLFPVPTDIKDHIDIIKQKLSEMKPTILSQNACVSLSKDAIIAVNEYLQILNLELNKLGDEVSTNIEHNINKKIENTNDVDAISKVLLEMNIAHSIASSQLNCCVNLDQYLKLINDLCSKLNCSSQITQKISKQFNMIAFYSKINRNGKIDFKFIEVIIDKIKQTSIKIQTKINKLVSQEKKKQIKQKNENQIKLREENHKIQLLRYKEEMKKIQIQNQNKLLKQQIEYEKRMRNNLNERIQMQRQLAQRKAQNLEAIKKKQKQFNFWGFAKDVVSIGVGIVQIFSYFK